MKNCPFIFSFSIVFHLLPLISIFWLLAVGASYGSGWGTLVRHYHYSGQITGTIFRMQSLFIGGLHGMWKSRYAYCFRFAINENGIGITCWRFFCPLYNQVFIPWSEISWRQKTMEIKKIKKEIIFNIWQNYQTLNPGT